MCGTQSSDTVEQMCVGGMHYLSEEGVLVGHLILQFVIEVVNRRGLSLGGEVTLLQRGDPLFHVLLLGHRLHIQTITKFGLAPDVSSLPSVSTGLGTK